MASCYTIHKLDLALFPPETWINIFECVEKPSHLFNIILTSKHLYELAIRVLYRHVSWDSPLYFLQNRSFWERDTSSMASVPISFVLSISYLSQTEGFGRYNLDIAIVNADGSYFNGPRNGWSHLTDADENSQGSSSSRITYLFASAALYDLIQLRISSFSRLRDLTLQHCTLPKGIYDTIKSLPRLNKLMIHHCILPPADDIQVDEFVNSPITTLSMHHICDEEHPSRPNYCRALQLCSAPNLRVLDIGWNTSSISLLLPTTTNPDPQIIVAREITDLVIRFEQRPSDTIVDEAELGDLLSKFFLSHPSITDLTVEGSPLSMPRLIPGCLPHLERFSGTSKTISSVVKGAMKTIYSIKHLAISNSRDLKMESLAFIIEELNDLQLDSLLIGLQRWDMEIMYPLSKCLPSLKKLEIIYSEGWPDEYSLLSLGSRFLYRFRDLEVIHIYKHIYHPPLSRIAFNDRTPAHESNNTNLDGDEDDDVVDDGDLLPSTPSFASFARTLSAQNMQSTAFGRNGNRVRRVSDSHRITPPVATSPFAGKMEEELREVLLAWNKPCPKLREVRLERMWVWKKDLSKGAEGEEEIKAKGKGKATDTRQAERVQWRRKRSKADWA
ncbi:hypothetical protein BDQ12DRAFT_736250 [Crucibulum laeve]|uniref:F-box domain-containing protein n=1 Tax=Crucibulum laeve TaxID=68775 RepID=A0A5C3M8B1_9AGAR|nr:hypothetical protein BDQ12DRAFT_736250 [Crucibulum laeve]